MPLPLFIPAIVKGLLWAGGLVGFGVGAAKYTQHSEENYFNKGVCKKCGGHFKYIEGTESKGNRGYKCDFCDNCVWVAFGSDEGYVYVPSKRSQKG